MTAGFGDCDSDVVDSEAALLCNPVGGPGALKHRHHHQSAESLYVNTTSMLSSSTSTFSVTAHLPVTIKCICCVNLQSVFLLKQSVAISLI